MKRDDERNIILKYADQLSDSGRFLMAEKVSKKQLDNANSNFAYILDLKDTHLIAFCDGTENNSGKYGYVFLDGLLIYKEAGGENISIVYSSIDSIEIKEDSASRDCDKKMLIKYHSSIEEKDYTYKLYAGYLNKTPLKEMLMELCEYYKAVNAERNKGKPEIVVEKIVVNLTKEEKFDLVKKYIPDIAGIYNYYLGDNIPAKILKNVIKRYDPRLKEEDILGLVDTSLFNSGKSGCLFTVNKIYWTDSIGSASCVKYDDIDIVFVMGDKLDDSENSLVMNMTYDIYKSFDIEYVEVKKTPLCELLNQLKSIRTIKTEKQPSEDTNQTISSEIDSNSGSVDLDKEADSVTIDKKAQTAKEENISSHMSDVDNICPTQRVWARCTSCGEEIQIDSEKDADICKLCGNPFIVEKAIRYYQDTLEKKDSFEMKNNINEEDIDEIKQGISTMVSVLEKVAAANGNSQEENKKIGATVRLDIAKFMMYLSASDGTIQWDEVKMIIDICNLEEDLTPDNIGTYIRKNNIYSKEFEQTPPKILIDFVNVDYELVKNGVDVFDFLEENLFKDMPFSRSIVFLFELIGKKLIESDGCVSENEKQDFEIYINMMKKYVDENAVGPKSPSTGFVKK